MSKGNTFENDLLLLIFNATGIANIADNAASRSWRRIGLDSTALTPSAAGALIAIRTMDGQRVMHEQIARLGGKGYFVFAIGFGSEIGHALRKAQYSRGGVMPHA